MSAVGTIVLIVPCPIACQWITWINVLLLVINESEYLLANVEVALDCAGGHRELRRRVADLVKLELSVNLIYYLQHVVQIIKASKGGKDITNEETIVKEVLRVVILPEDFQQYLGYPVGSNSVVADFQHVLARCSAVSTLLLIFLLTFSIDVSELVLLEAQLNQSVGR